MKKAYLVLVDGRGMPADRLMHPLISDVRLKKMARRKAENLLIDSACCELAYLAAQKKAFGRVKKNLYDYGDNDKPYFIDGEYGFLSLAHAANIGACLIAPVGCGCDIEEKGRDVSRIDKKIRFSEEETQSGLVLWCVKESYGKLTGKGLLHPFSALLFKKDSIFDESGKRLAWAKTGEIGCVVWAVALEEEMDIEIVTLTAQEALSV